MISGVVAAGLLTEVATFQFTVRGGKKQTKTDSLFSVSLHELELTGDGSGLVPYLLVLKQH